ncbi:methylaspartate mutase [Streptomyces sp. NPDC014773]|uniref:methylaspartate mutase n=1 Tax=Streptomyces sp. NPDC014773 TaxID=3364908 RepID=UPI0036FC4695
MNSPQPAVSTFSRYVRDSARAGGVPVVQPRMGFSDPRAMRRGLAAVRALGFPTCGTVTLDSYTRVGDHGAARAACADGTPLNGYPIVAHGARSTRAVLAGLAGDDFPVQIRHGSAAPFDLFEVMLASGVRASEGGPVSYCLPYGRVPLATAVAEWQRACELLAGAGGVHMETFGGCMLGQLCPPSLLVALSLLEAVFFRQHGVRSVSLSYAQQTSLQQDVEAVLALRALAARFLPDVDWHVVVYTYMGLYPHDPAKAGHLLRGSAELAVLTGAERLIVKTPAEHSRIPTVAENVGALRTAAEHARRVRADPPASPPAGRDAPAGVLAEALALVESVLSLDELVGTALLRAFRSGLLDVPYCIHPDNRNRARSFLDPAGRLQWRSTGNMAVRPHPGASAAAAPGRRAEQFERQLSHWNRAETFYSRSGKSS